MKGQYTMLNDKQKVFVDILKKEYPDMPEIEVPTVSPKKEKTLPIHSASLEAK